MIISTFSNRARRLPRRWLSSSYTQASPADQSEPLARRQPLAFCTEGKVTARAILGCRQVQSWVCDPIPSHLPARPNCSALLAPRPFISRSLPPGTAAVVSSPSPPPISVRGPAGLSARCAPPPPAWPRRAVKTALNGVGI